MELLGTNGSTPGPTAARALVAYNAQQLAASTGGKVPGATLPPRPSHGTRKHKTVSAISDELMGLLHRQQMMQQSIQ